MVEGLNRSPPPDHRAINRQQNNGAEYRHNEAGRLTFLVKAESPPNEAAQQGAGDSQKDRNNKSSRIASGHQKLPDDSNNQSEDDPSNPSKHSRFLSSVGLF